MAVIRRRPAPLIHDYKEDRNREIVKKPKKPFKEFLEERQRVREMEKNNKNIKINRFEGVYQCEVSLEEQEKIMNSKWFNDWMKEYHSKSENFSWE